MIYKKSALGNGEALPTAPRNFRLKICSATPKRYVDWSHYDAFPLYLKNLFNRDEYSHQGPCTNNKVRFGFLWLYFVIEAAIIDIIGAAM